MKSLRRLIESAIDEESQAAQQAKGMGLVSKGWGRWADRNGNITHKTVQGRLTPVKGQAPGGGQAAQAMQQPQAKAQPQQEPTLNNKDINKISLQDKHGKGGDNVSWFDGQGKPHYGTIAMVGRGVGGGDYSHNDYNVSEKNGEFHIGMSPSQLYHVDEPTITKKKAPTWDLPRPERDRNGRTMGADINDIENDRDY
jgi:hypothetical protein